MQALSATNLLHLLCLLHPQRSQQLITIIPATALRRRGASGGAGLVGLLQFEEVVGVEDFADVKVVEFDELGAVDGEFEVEDVVVLSEEGNAADFWAV